MPWPLHRLLLLCSITFGFKDCHSLFLRHTQTGKCIAATEERVYNNPSWALPYFVKMTDNCLDEKAEFRYFDGQLLHNIEKEGTLVSPLDNNTDYNHRWAVYKGVGATAKRYQKYTGNYLKQTAAGILSIYNRSTPVCAEPSSGYIKTKKNCNKTQQEFTFGSVTSFGTKMRNIHCSSIQDMMVKSADYGDFNMNGNFSDDKNTDWQCSYLTNCQVKSLCNGKRYCGLTIDNILLPSQYCSNTSKQIYTKYTCVDSYNSSAITAASSIRLSQQPNQGYVQIENGLTWRYVKEENWDINREKMLCQHLGFHETNEVTVTTGHVSSGYKIVTGDLICYNTQPSKTSCCVFLKPSTTNETVHGISYARCKICDNPILQESTGVFSGSGSTDYKRARFNSSIDTGWCASGFTPHLMVDLQKEYHITQVVVMGNRDQTKWSETYLMKYSHNKTLANDSAEIRISGNKNGYRASTTNVNVYNVRYIKIQSIGSTDFCLRIEFCGEVQKPAPVYDIRITPYKYAANVTWKIPAQKNSSYITKLIIYLNGTKCQNISRTTVAMIYRLKPETSYNVQIETQDGSFQKSTRMSKSFKTKKAGKLCDKPLLKDTTIFPNRVFSGKGGSDYYLARFANAGWCPYSWGLGKPHLSLDLQKEYHITQVIVMGNKNQTKWSQSYVMRYSHNKTYQDKKKITGNRNGYKESTTTVNLYNVKHIMIRPSRSRKFCLRIELCGTVQGPAPVYDIEITPNPYGAHVKWKILTEPKDSSYITNLIIYLNGTKCQIISRGTSAVINGLKPYTLYNVEITTEDGSSQRSIEVSKSFKTNETVPGSAPRNVAFVDRRKRRLKISWGQVDPLDKLNGELKGYQVCYSATPKSSSPRCVKVDKHESTYLIKNLDRATKYFVTVAAGTMAGYGTKSREINKTTNGVRVNPVPHSYSSLNLTITKPTVSIREVAIIVKIATDPENGKTAVEDIQTDSLHSYKNNTEDPYITAYFEANLLPLTFVIGDGKEYNNSEKEKYINQPLKQNSSYFVFLRFFENLKSYYSSGWSKSVMTWVKPPAPNILKIISTGIAQYTISWDQPTLPDQQTIVMYHAHYGPLQGSSKKSISSMPSQRKSITIDVSFDQQYEFTIQVETKAGKSDKAIKSWLSHSEPLRAPEKTKDGYLVILRKPKHDREIKTVELVMLQLRSNLSKPAVLENLHIQNSHSSNTMTDNVAFIAKMFDISEFQNDTMEVLLREFKENRRRKREATEVYSLVSGATYRVTQINRDSSGNVFRSYWSEPFTYIKATINDGGNGDEKNRDGDSNDGNVGIVVGSSLGVVVIVVLSILAAIFLKRRYKDREASSKENGDDTNEIGDIKEKGVFLNTSGDVQETPYLPVPVAEFPQYVNELKENENYNCQKQYDDLPQNMKTSWEVAKKPFNKQKNRYGNIVTYDYCRVVLSGDKDEDYINASYIDGIKENSYIACQGPTILTLHDMWRMVWEQRSYSIVMVTSLFEGTKQKCEKYWPDSKTEKYGDIEVTLKNVEEFADYTTRILELNKDGEKREVRHYYFQSWPDHGVPKYPTQLLAFRKYFRKHHLEQSGPIVVHCSAGVGRTGVFLAIDTILDKLEKGVINSIDVFGQVCAMRARRMYMVQTMEQYMFVHEAILENILCGMNEVDSTEVQQEIESLAEIKASGMTGFEEKFRRLDEISPKFSSDECIAALLTSNANKNRNKEIYPAESNRVPLQYVDGMENSDYINAVFVHGFLGRNYFIATQSPLPNTINDFWRLVHSQKSSTIVLLNNVKDGTSFPIFWPTEKEKPAQYDSLTVQLESEKESDGIRIRKFILSPYPDLSHGEVVNIFHYTKWPDHRVPSSVDAVIMLNSLVENSKRKYGQGPIVVACSDGAGRTGTYIAISNLLERVKIEQTMDVFQSIKIIRGTRPQFVENAEQYEFCYTAIMAYLDGFSDYANFAINC